MKLFIAIVLTAAVLVAADETPTDSTKETATSKEAAETTDETAALSADEATWTAEEIAWARESIREACAALDSIREHRDAVATRAFKDAAAEAAAAGLSASACLDAGGVAYNAVIADYADAYNAAYDAAYTNRAATAAAAIASYRDRNTADFAAAHTALHAAYAEAIAAYDAALAAAWATYDPRHNPANAADYDAACKAAKVAEEAAEKAADDVYATARDRNTAEYDARRGFTPPEKVSSTEPVCPPALKEAGWSGSCSIGLYIDESGNVGKVWVIRSTGKSEADQAALAAAQASQWRPATQNGVPIAEKVFITYDF